MGYDVARFMGDVDEELLCPICSGVLEDPLQAPECEHAFCMGCIQEWLGRQPTCPVDRQRLVIHHLKPVPRILRNLLSRLDISCENSKFGCQETVKLDRLEIHVSECDFNPKRPVPCAQGCGIVIPKDELKDHNCVREMRLLLQQQQNRISTMQQELGEQKVSNAELRRSLDVLREAIQPLLPRGQTLPTIYESRASNGVVPMNTDNSPVAIRTPASPTSNGASSSDDSEMIMTIAQMATGHNASDAALIMQLSNQSGMSAGASANAASEANSLSSSMNQDLMDWVASLRPARVTRWGGMISTPDTTLQAVVKRALLDSGCPSTIAMELMENAHERKWPPGLNTLETRQLNRRVYENYVPKRIPGKQAVVITSCDNRHMGHDMILEPGLIMIFAHGVE